MNKFLNIMFGALLLAALPACKDKESYADLLRDENYAVNDFLVNYPVITSIPVDSVFITTKDVESDPAFREEFADLNETELHEAAIMRTPFYRMDEDGYVYMQVLDPGTGARAVADQQIWFRFTRYNLKVAYETGEWEPSGNEQDVASNPTSFRYRNTTLTSTTNWGTGIQVPLDYLKLNCHVRMVIKSYLGPVQEVSSVYPFLYNIRYYPSRV